MQVPTDDHGQPISQRIQRTARVTRDIDELLGICRGVAFDGDVNQQEAENLYAWLSANAELASVYPGDIIIERLADALRDGVLDEKEASDLLVLLKSVIGGQVQAVAEKVDYSTGEVLRKLTPTELPIDDDVDVVFDGMVFTVTGEFCSGKRKEVEQEITKRGGACVRKPNRSTDYVVVGTFASRDWVHGNYGRKIEYAIEIRAAGYGINLISEERLLKALRATLHQSLEAARYDDV